MPSSVGDEIRTAAARAYPREACGFLVGVGLPDGARVDAARPASNRAERSDRFTIDAHQVWEALRRARHEGRELLGVYHSHPDAAASPSPTDRAEAWGDFVWLIVPCHRGTAGEPRCWEWRGSSFRPVSIEWV